MRDLLFKNLTSSDHRRRIIASSEISDKAGVRSVIHRHFVCLAKEITSKEQASRPLPYLYVLRERNQNQMREKFFCRLKGSMYLAHKGRLYLILFMHSLKIQLSGLTEKSKV